MIFVMLLKSLNYFLTKVIFLIHIFIKNIFEPYSCIKRFGKHKYSVINIFADADYKYSFSVLRDTTIFSIENFPIGIKS